MSVTMQESFHLKTVGPLFVTSDGLHSGYPESASFNQMTLDL